MRLRREAARGGGVQLALPASWSKLVPARDQVDEPRTLLVIGTDGSRAIESDCQVSSYRVPADGAVVVVIGWRVGGGSFLPPSRPSSSGAARSSASPAEAPSPA